MSTRLLMYALCAGALVAFGPRLATAFQQQVVGGHALDANLRVDGSGFNTARTTNRVSGMQNSRYRPNYSVPSSSGLASRGYSPRRNTSGSVDTRYRSGGYSIDTGYGSYTAGRGGGRADPLRNSQYSVLQTGTYVERGAIPGGGRSYAQPRGMTTPKPTAYRAYHAPSTRVPSAGLTMPKYSVVHRR